MIRFKKNSKEAKGKSKKREEVSSTDRRLFFGVLCVIFVILGFLSFQGFIFCKYKLENYRLVSLKKEYSKLFGEIEEYKLLKSQYEVVLSESGDLQSNKEALEKKVSGLNSDIEGLEIKIADVNKKIKNLS